MVSAFAVRNTFLGLGRNPLVPNPRAFDYGHNLIEFHDGIARILDVDHDDNRAGDFTFGKLTAQRVFSERHPERTVPENIFSTYGWIGHQIAERYAHGPSSYNAQSGRSHAGAEFEIDAFFYRQFQDDQEFLKRLRVTVMPEVIHEASIDSFNILTSTTGGSLISRKSGLLTDARIKEISRKWASWLKVHLFAVRKWASSRNIQTFQPTTTFNQFFESAIAYLSSFLRSPDFTIPTNTIVLNDTAERFFADFQSLWKELRSVLSRFIGGKTIYAQDTEDEEFLGEDYLYQFIDEIATRGETNDILTVHEIANNDGSITLEGEILDEARMDEITEEVIDAYLGSDDQQFVAAGRFFDQLLNNPEADFDDAEAIATDFNPPVITFTTDESEYLHGIPLDPPVIIEDEGSGVASVEYLLDGVPLDETPITFYDAAIGEHELTVKATDRAGQASEETIAFTFITNWQDLIRIVEQLTNDGHIMNQGLGRGLTNFLERGAKARKNEQKKLLENFRKLLENAATFKGGAYVDEIAFTILDTDAEWLIEYL
ncbi:MAG: hypothetical protein HY459_00245 [Parcubacteria group bacterium]|nr:hypothetical protein [Parcubacteria group bacterium]